MTKQEHEYVLKAATSIEEMVEQIKKLGAPPEQWVLRRLEHIQEQTGLIKEIIQ